MKFLLALALVLVMFTDVPRPVHGNCCLCMCHAFDESLCSDFCIRLQNGTKIVEEPEMEECTGHCLRKGVEQTQ